MKKSKFSIRHEFLLLIAISVLFISGVVLLYIIPKSKSIISNSIQNNMNDIVTLSSKLIDSKVEQVGIEHVGTPELTKILSDIGIQDVPSSYIYVVDLAKTFVYHPKEEKIGTEVFNQTVADLIDDVNSGANYNKACVFSYTDENGVKKYAAYCVSTVSNYVVVIVGDEKDALATLNSMANGSYLIIIAVTLIMLIIAFIVANNIIRPILAMTTEIEKTATLDFSDDGILLSLTKSRTETGLMATAMISMQNGLRDMVNKLKVISSEMYSNAESLTDVTLQINAASTDNSATSEELAASMQETSATASLIDSNMGEIMKHTEDINTQAIDGVQLANDISKRANDMNQNTISAYRATKDMYADVKTKTEEAIERSKSVEKVNELATGIQEIADQTSLLSLNASIEAARAGEHGRGFAIVASEIGTLANQSAKTVQAIMSIVQEVNEAVANMESCMSTTLSYIETQVLHDYEMFESVSKQYDQDAAAVDSSMNAICHMTENLKSTAQDIVGAVSGISNTINEAALGVTDIAEKTCNIVELSSNVVHVVDNTSENSRSLESIADSFNL